METKLNFEGNYYDKYDSKNPVVKKIMNGFFSSLSDCLKEIDFNSILEVGCGEGELTNYLYSQFPQIVKIEAFDIGENTIKKARETYPNIHFNIYSIYDAPYKSDSYDLVVCCEVLEHLEKPQQGLQKIFDISSKYVLLSVPNEPIWRISNIARGKYLGKFGNTPGHIQHWSKNDFVKLVSKYGRILKVMNPYPWTMLICEKSQ